MVLKRASRSPVASANTSATIQPKPRGKPPESPNEQDHRRRDAEIHEVGQAVELGAEPRLRFERARQASVNPIEQGGDDDERNGQLVAQLDRHADGREPGA